VVGVFDVPPNRPPLAHMVVDLVAAVSYRFAMGNRYVFQPLTLPANLTEAALNRDPGLYINLMSELREGIVRRFPFLERSVLQPGWSGLIERTPDGLPLVGETDVLGVFVLTGTGNHGFAVLPALAQDLAAALGGDTDAGARLAPLAPQRFRRGVAYETVFNSFVW
jgi:glycine/D-amino acid oxidase-like deaminating enzyme